MTNVAILGAGNIARQMAKTLRLMKARGDKVELYAEGKLRAIGVSNFYPARYLDINHFAEIKPAVNQVETHVFQQQKVAKEYMKKNGTQIESWGPFAEGKNNYFTNPVLKEIGDKYGKSVAQVALRFLLQSDVVVIPKSTHVERMEENFQWLDLYDKNSGLS